jgi:hypothetical protein
MRDSSSQYRWPHISALVGSTKLSHTVTPAFNLRILDDRNHFSDFGTRLPVKKNLWQQPGTVHVSSAVETVVCKCIRGGVYRNNERDVWITMRSTELSSILPPTVRSGCAIALLLQGRSRWFPIGKMLLERARSVSAAFAKCKYLALEDRLLKQNFVIFGILKGAQIYSD